MCCDLWPTAKLSCLPCVKALGTRQSACATVSCHHRLFLAECRVMHTAKALPCARQKTHGKEGLCRRLVAVGLLPCATHGKAFAVCKPGFAVCFRHTANSLCPVGASELGPLSISIASPATPDLLQPLRPRRPRHPPVLMLLLAARLPTCYCCSAKGRG